MRLVGTRREARQVLFHWSLPASRASSRLRGVLSGARGRKVESISERASACSMGFLAIPNRLFEGVDSGEDAGKELNVESGDGAGAPGEDWDG